MKIIDISVPITKDMAVWPGDAPPCITKVSKIKKRGTSNETRIDMSLHAGTHVDAPLHFLANGGPIDTVPLSQFVGSVFVAHLPNVRSITAAHLMALHLPKGTTRLLVRTDNSVLHAKKHKRFKKDFVGLRADAAAWLAKQGMQLVGVDYLSVAAFDDVVDVHEILLKKKTVLLEGLDLSRVKPGHYQLIALPLNIPGVEAAPVRAILLQE